MSADADLARQLGEAGAQPLPLFELPALSSSKRYPRRVPMDTVTYLGGPLAGTTAPSPEPPPALVQVDGGRYRLAGDGRTYGFEIGFDDQPGDVQLGFADDGEVDDTPVEHIRPANGQSAQVRPKPRRTTRR